MLLYEDNKLQLGTYMVMTALKLQLIVISVTTSVKGIVASIAQWQSTGLVNQGSRVQLSLVAILFIPKKVVKKSSRPCEDVLPQVLVSKES